MTYTTDITNQKYFLTDKNIAHKLDYGDIQLNAIPSLCLLISVDNELSAYDSNLCTYISSLSTKYESNPTESSPYLSVITSIQQDKGQLSVLSSVELLSSHVRGLKELVDDMISSLDVDILSSEGKLVRVLKQVNGKISADFSQVISSDINGLLQQDQIEGLTASLSAKQDKLSDAQVSAINSVVDERKTVVTYTDNTSAEFDVVGELTSDIFPDKPAVASVKIGTAVTSLGRQVFEQCRNLSSVTLPNSITSIGDYAFNGCTNLTNVTIPDSVTSIGDVAFGGCFALETITIPKSVEYIGFRAFENTESLTRCVFEEKSAQEVQSMANYYWGVYSTSIIGTWNAASQEWTKTQLSNNLSLTLSNCVSLSTAVDSKIFINGISAQSLCAVHISQEDFYEKVHLSALLNNALYIVSGDYINAYGQQIKNAINPIDQNDVTTKQYVDALTSQLSIETTSALTKKRNIYDLSVYTEKLEWDLYIGSSTSPVRLKPVAGRNDFWTDTGEAQGQINIQNIANGVWVVRSHDVRGEADDVPEGTTEIEFLDNDLIVARAIAITVVDTTDTIARTSQLPPTADIINALNGITKPPLNTLISTDALSIVTNAVIQIRDILSSLYIVLS